MNKTTIEWCDFTVNPIRFRPSGSDRTTTMCHKLSPGCANCYAADIVRRFWPRDANVEFPGYTAQGIAAGEFVLDEKQLRSVLTSKAAGKVFWGDMTDLFGAWVPFEMLDKCFAVCGLKQKLTHIFLTKRTERMLEYLDSRSKSIRYWETAARDLGYTFKFDGVDGVEHSLCPFPLPNVWCGTSVEKAEYKHRIDTLREVPAAVRMLSLEPLLGPLGELNLDGIHWVITGGESGSQARPMASRWASEVQEQCEAAGVAYFHKQNGQFVDAGHEEFGRLPEGTLVHIKSDGTVWGKDLPQDENADVTTMKRVTRERAGDTLYGKRYQAYPK